jgi:hypothetical protein
MISFESKTVRHQRLSISKLIEKQILSKICEMMNHFPKFVAYMGARVSFDDIYLDIEEYVHKDF